MRRIKGVWTYTAVNLSGRECGHDHRSIKAALRCFSAVGDNPFLILRSPDDRERGRPTALIDDELRRRRRRPKPKLYGTPHGLAYSQTTWSRRH